MQHYKLVQQRFSTETMNSDDKMQAKEEKQNAAGQTQMPVQEAPKPNGVALLPSANGHAHLHESDQQDSSPVVQQDRKGKGKAKLEGILGKKDKGKGKAKAV